jgi:hypothetical protein
MWIDGEFSSLTGLWSRWQEACPLSYTTIKPLYGKQ